MFVFNFHTNGNGNLPIDVPPPEEAHRGRRADAPVANPTLDDVHDLMDRANERIDTLERERSYWRRQAHKRERELEEATARAETRNAGQNGASPSTGPIRPISHRGKGRGKSKSKGKGKGGGHNSQRQRTGPGWTEPIRPTQSSMGGFDPTQAELDEVVQHQQRERRQRRRQTRPKYQSRPRQVLAPWETHANPLHLVHWNHTRC